MSGGPWRGPVLAAEDLRTERPLTRWEEAPWIREPLDSGPETLRVTGERKCQSLGTEEWRPAVGLGRQLSDGEAERWSQEQQHRQRPAEGNVPMAVRMKSQSLPRVLSPEDPQYGELPQAGASIQASNQRMSSVPYGRYQSEWPTGERWTSQNQSSVALVPKPRFSRPIKPPSYETHQQNRGSWETLSSEPVSKPRDRSICYSQSMEPIKDRSVCYSQSAEPLRDRSMCFSQSADPIRDRMVSHSQSAEPLRDRFLSHSQSADLLRDRFLSHSYSADLLRDRSLCYSSELLRDRSICYSQSAELLRPETYRADLFYHELTGSEPPGYIPPPSYRRFLPPRSGQIYRADSALVRWKREPVTAEMGEWFSRTAGMSWSERQEDRSMAVVPRRPGHLGTFLPNRPLQYIPLEDPRIRHISGGPSGNSLTDADKIRHVNKELPCTAALGQSTLDSAFFLTQMTTDTQKPAPGEHDSAIRWNKAINKGGESAAPDQSFSKFPTSLQPRPLQPGFKPDRVVEQPVRLERIPDQSLVKVEKVTEQVKVDRTAEQLKVEKTTDLAKPDRVAEQVKVERLTEIKPDRFTDRQIKPDQTKIDKVPDQGKIKLEIKLEKNQDKLFKSDKILDKLIKLDKAPEKPIKVDKIPEKLKAEKISDKPSKSEKFTDKLIKSEKQTKADISVEQIKSEKVTDKQTKSDKCIEKGSSESVSTAKMEQAYEPEKKSVKKKLSETIFCLVSVPLSQSSGKLRDQNNNEEKDPESPRIPPPPPPSSSSENSNTLGSLPNQSLKSTSTTSTDLELQALTLGSASSSIVSRRRRRNSRTKIIKPNPHDELRRYSGAWPGDQYRDQETQTSPELAKSAQHPGPDKIEAQTLPAVPEVEASVESGLGASSGAGPTGGTCAPAVTGASTATEKPGSTATPAAPAAPGASEPGTPYGYPMKGQKSLKPSCNSAFSRTGTFKSTGSHRPPLHPPPHPPPPPPNQPPSQPPPPPPSQPSNKSPPSDQTEDAKSAGGPNSETFGQFILKPATKRSWDAIEELESINKELQEQANKRPSVDQCIEDLNEAYKDIMELSTASNTLSQLPNCSSMQIPDRIKARMSSDPLGMPATTLRPSLVPGSDPEYREVKSAFSRPSTGKSVSFSKQLREEICPVPPPSETGFRDYKSVMAQINQRKACRSVKLEFMAPRESLLKNDSLNLLTASTSSMPAELPWADRQPMQDASTLTSPPDYEHICQTLQMSRDSGAISRGAPAKSKPGSSNSSDHQHVSKPSGSAVDSEQPCCSSSLDNESQTKPEPMPLFKDEISAGFRRVTSQSNKILGNRSVICGIAAGKSIGDKAGIEKNPEVPADWQMQLTLAEKHIATLITADGTKDGSVEDEINIMRKEETLKVGEGNQPNEIVDEDTLVSVSKKEVPELEEVQQGSIVDIDDSQLELEKSQQDSVLEVNEIQEQINKNEETQEPKKEPVVILRSNKAAIWTHSCLESGLLPEFPPDHLPLSVLAYPNRRLSLELDSNKNIWEGASWSLGRGLSRERRSFDAERQDLGEDRWSLDSDRQQSVGEKRGLGGWRGCGIDRQGSDDSDWDIDIDNQYASEKGSTQEHDQSDDQSSNFSNKDLTGDKFTTVLKEHIQGAEESPGVTEVQDSERRSCALPQRIEVLHDRFIAPPGHGSEERLARMREVNTVSRMRRLSLRSTDSWDGLYGVAFVSTAEELETDDKRALPSSQDLPNASENGKKESREICTDSSKQSSETKGDQTNLTGTFYVFFFGFFLSFLLRACI